MTAVTPRHLDASRSVDARLRLIPLPRPEAVTDALRRDRTFLRLPRPARLLPFPKGMMPLRALDALGRRLFSLYL